MDTLARLEQTIAGRLTASPEESYVANFEAAGLRSVEVLSQSDYFSGSSSAETRKVAGSFGAQAIVLRAEKP